MEVETARTFYTQSISQPETEPNKTDQQATPLPDSEAFSIAFLASVPAVGWATYYVGVCRLTHWTDYEGEGAHFILSHHTVLPASGTTAPNNNRTHTPPHTRTNGQTPSPTAPSPPTPCPTNSSSPTA